MSCAPAIGRYHRTVALLLGLALAVTLTCGETLAVNVGLITQPAQEARAVVQDSGVVLTGVGNQSAGASGSEAASVPTDVTGGNDGVVVNIVVLGKGLLDTEKYYEFTIQASAANTAFPAGNLRIRYVDSASIERTADVPVSAADAPTGGERAGATIQLPSAASDFVTNVQVVFEETITVSNDTATVKRVVLSASGLTDPG